MHSWTDSQPSSTFVANGRSGSNHPDHVYRRRTDDSGSASWRAWHLLKDADVEVLLQAIERVARGETLIQPEVMERVLLHAERALTAPAQKQSVLM